MTEAIDIARHLEPNREEGEFVPLVTNDELIRAMAVLQRLHQHSPCDAEYSSAVAAAILHFAKMLELRGMLVAVAETPLVKETESAEIKPGTAVDPNRIVSFG